MAAIALGALCLSAQAGDVTFTYGSQGTMTSQPANTVVTNISGSWEAWDTNGSKQTVVTFQRNNIGASTSMPSVIISSGAKWQYTLTFTPVADITTGSITVALGIGNAEADSNSEKSDMSIGVPFIVNTTGTLSSSGFDSPIAVQATGTNSREQSGAYTLNDDWTAITQGSGTILTYDLGGSKTLTANQEYSFSVSVECGVDPLQPSKVCRVGLAGIRFNAVPEPATATLSLLALAGLAARRRRK